MDRNYKKYRKFVIQNFQKFLNNEIDNDTLNDNLHVIQDDLGFMKQRSRIMKGVWFKFTKDDTLCYTINMIHSELKFGSLNNIEYLKKMMKLAVDNPKGLQIYYS